MMTNARTIATAICTLTSAKTLAEYRNALIMLIALPKIIKLFVLASILIQAMLMSNAVSFIDTKR